MAQPLCLEDFEAFARKSLSGLVYEYYRAGCYPEQTLGDNVQAFKRYRLRPKLLRDVSRRDLRTTILGQEIAFPIAVAPTAMQRMAHSDGEVATAKAVTSLGTGMVLSCVTTSTMEEVAEASSPRGLRWAQLHIFKDETLVRSIVRKAETNGYKALIVTVDSPIGRRSAGESLKELPLHIRLAHFGGEKLSSGLTSLDNPKVTWSHIDWLSSITTLPIVLKGVLTGIKGQL
ncbi:hydroxyacid oxidase 1-like [Asterias rubens]|uniref:hydroxyacid oxidase 1-like n=1 Tax=Asterias rubens TaxID=7604 RepID=UPI001454F6DA|nr:hydroxyacid oxidase 1-like [Asterias rubens]